MVQAGVCKAVDETACATDLKKLYLSIDHETGNILQAFQVP
jgi:hypothetical protein